MFSPKKNIKMYLYTSLSSPGLGPQPTQTRDLRLSRTQARVPGRVFSFYFDFEEAAASFSFGHLYALSMDASRALCAAVCLRWPGVCRSRSWAVTLGRAGGAKPVPSGMDWLGACPGGGTT